MQMASSIWENYTDVRKNGRRPITEHLFPQKKGNAEAQYLVGMMHMGGLGTEMDTKEAVFWWARAAKQGNQDALDMLRKMGKEDLTKDPFFR